MSDHQNVSCIPVAMVVPASSRNSAGRIRLTFLVAGVVLGVAVFLWWDRRRLPSSFPVFEQGRYVGMLSDLHSSGALVALPMVVDVPKKGDPLLLVMDDQNVGGVVIKKLPQGEGHQGPLRIDIAGGEEIKLVGGLEALFYRGIGTRASGGELRWVLERARTDSDAPPPELSDYLVEKAKVALVERRIEAVKSGVAKAVDESAQLKQAVELENKLRASAETQALSAQERLQKLDESIAQVESERAELMQKISLVESIAPGSRVSRAVYRTLSEQHQWISSVLLTSLTSSSSPEDAEALQRGIEVDALQRAIVTAQRRIDVVLRASDKILGGGSGQ